MKNSTVTAAALALGAGAVLAHRSSSIGGGMEPIIKDLASNDMVRGVAFGAGGGAVVSIVSKTSLIELLGRVFVGGTLAATLSPWLAEGVLHMSTSSVSYPVLCTSIGVLGFQLVRAFIDHPERIPVIGRVLEAFIKPPPNEPGASPAVNVQPQASQPAQHHSPPPGPSRPPRVPVYDWTPQVKPEPPRRINVPRMG